MNFAWWVRVSVGGGVVAATLLGSLMGSLGSCADAPPAPREQEERVGVVRQPGSTGVCDSNPPISSDACISAIQANGGVVNDIFRDVNGLTGPELPVFGTLFQQWPACTELQGQTSFAGCSGQSLAPADCAGQYQCTGLVNTFANASSHLNALDRLFWHPMRITDHNYVGNCPNWGAGVADGQTGHYFPWEGLVFDLGGPSNKVAIFAENDHGPQPCESLEYTVFLTDDPFSRNYVLQPAVTGVDPTKWNRAVLSEIFTKGWIEVRPPDPAGHSACGDTVDYAVEEDSFAQVFSLPCGITFRYAAIVAGNDGRDFPECAFDSNEAELDAVAGLTEDGAGVCPDDDEDLYVDCACDGAPALCDCNDAAADVNPGEPEPCDSADVNCDGLPGACNDPLVCHEGLCVPRCDDELASCPQGSTCTDTARGSICVPDDCSVGGCPPGSVCDDGQCVPACTDVVCPGTQICQDGNCIDPCADIACPPPLVCQDAQCVPPCSCYDGDLGCVDLPGTVCDRGGSDRCVSPLCVGANCAPNQTCDPATGNCLDFCHPGVQCPLGKKCDPQLGCVEMCHGVTCDPGWSCDPETGECVDHRCEGVFCEGGQVCVDGMCVDEGTSGAGGGTSGQGGGANSGRRDAADPGGCGCRSAASARPFGAPVALLVAMALGARRRRRRGDVVRCR
jgi:MYXO-CTERM domain-containing protein